MPQVLSPGQPLFLDSTSTNESCRASAGASAAALIRSTVLQTRPVGFKQRLVESAGPAAIYAQHDGEYGGLLRYDVPF